MILVRDLKGRLWRRWGRGSGVGGGGGTWRDVDAVEAVWIGDAGEDACPYLRHRVPVATSAVEDPVACLAERLVMEPVAEGLAMESAAGMARPYLRVLMAMSAVEPVAMKDESVRAAWSWRRGMLRARWMALSSVSSR